MPIEIPELDCDLSPDLERAQGDWMLGLSLEGWPHVRYAQLPRMVRRSMEADLPAELIDAMQQARRRDDFPARRWLEWWAPLLDPVLGAASSACICNRSRRKGAIDIRLLWCGGPSTQTMLRHIKLYAPKAFEWRIMLARCPVKRELEALSRSIERTWGAAPPWEGASGPMFAPWFRGLRYRRARLDKALCAWIDAFAECDGTYAPKPIAPPPRADIAEWLTATDPEVRSFAFRVSACAAGMVTSAD